MNTNFSFFYKIAFYFIIGMSTLHFLISPSWADIFGFQGDDGRWHFTHISIEQLQKYDNLIQQAATQFHVEPSLIKAVIKAESEFEKTAVSKKGAQGLMQLMPRTALEMDVDDPFHPEQNILGGTRYLSKLLERYKDNKRLALAAYNAGPEMVETYYGVPPFPETKNYVNKVLFYYKQFLSILSEPQSHTD